MLASPTVAARTVISYRQRARCDEHVARREHDCEARATEWREQQVALAVVVIPLLFETDAAPEFDIVVCTACMTATQRRRLEARGWTASQIQARLGAQWPLAQKMDRADAVIWTEGAMDLIGPQWLRLRDRSARSLFPSS